MESVIRLITQLKAAGIPFVTVEAVDHTDRSTWRIQFTENATEQQRAQAMALVAALDLGNVAPRTTSAYDIAKRLTRTERVAFRGKLLAGDVFLTDGWELLQLREKSGVPLSLDSPEVVAFLGYLAGATIDGFTISDPPVLASARRVAEIRGLA